MKPLPNGAEHLAGMDVIGTRAEPPSLEAEARVASGWPRPVLKRCSTPRIRAEATLKPTSNIAGHVALGFPDRIAAAPFAQ